MRQISDPIIAGLLEAAPDATVCVDSGGQIVLVNAQAERLFGYPREELAGQPVEILVPDASKAAHPGLRAAYVADPRPRQMDAGLDLSARRRDGTTFPAEISLAAIDTGRGLLMLAAVRDVTRQRQADARFRGLLEAAPDATVCVDESGRIVLVNAQAERLFGYPREELAGQPVEILVPDASKAAHPGLRAGYAADPRPRQMGAGMDLSARRRDGTTFPAEVALAAIDTGGGLLVSAAVRDVTQQRQERDDLRRTNQNLQQLGYSIAHDLRTPLRSLAGFSTVLIEDYADAPRRGGPRLRSADRGRQRAHGTHSRRPAAPVPRLRGNDQPPARRSRRRGRRHRRRTPAPGPGPPRPLRYPAASPGPGRRRPHPRGTAPPAGQRLEVHQRPRPAPRSSSG